MENYYYKVSKDHYAGKLLPDAHPENAYQVTNTIFNLSIFTPNESFKIKFRIKINFVAAIYV